MPRERGTQRHAPWRVRLYAPRSLRVAASLVDLFQYAGGVFLPDCRGKCPIKEPFEALPRRRRPHQRSDASYLPV